MANLTAPASKDLKQLCMEAYALASYLVKNNPTDEKAAGLLGSTVVEIKQMQELVKQKTDEVTT
ncbi:hypothetical protein [Pontibacter burrus]|uniref:Uncharacterized protein n=1 Tax=Pontibacter burrus TaxID=2704466 RepID=A0A6B3LQ88_9BACT|nr:hypothetical protein [Pontibacter burrus]NEM96158.1 hypothetical protein [Pontibacter burrus]